MVPATLLMIMHESKGLVKVWEIALLVLGTGSVSPSADRSSECFVACRCFC